MLTPVPLDCPVQFIPGPSAGGSGGSGRGPEVRTRYSWADSPWSASGQPAATPPQPLMFGAAGAAIATPTFGILGPAAFRHAAPVQPLPLPGLPAPVAAAFSFGGFAAPGQAQQVPGLGLAMPEPDVAVDGEEEADAGVAMPEPARCGSPVRITPRGSRHAATPGSAGGGAAVHTPFAFGGFQAAGPAPGTTPGFDGGGFAAGLLTPGLMFGHGAGATAAAAGGQAVPPAAGGAGMVADSLDMLRLSYFHEANLG